MTILRVNYSLQIAAGSLSFLASLTIVLMIKRVTLSTPYRRLIFGLSFADLLQSAALVTGPFANASQPQRPGGGLEQVNLYPWAHGTVQTCNVNGYLMAYGSTAVTLYSFCLSFYYYCKLNRKMTDRNFCLKFERKAHVLIHAFLLIGCTWALVLKSYNSIYGGTVCHFARYPLGCGAYPDVLGPCTRGLYVFPFVYIFLVGIPTFSFLGIMIFMVLLVRSAANIERMYSTNSAIIPNSTSANDTNKANNANNRKCCQSSGLLCFHQQQGEHESNANYVIRLYRIETVIQALLYISSFFVSYFVILITTFFGVANKIMPDAVQIIGSTLYPIMGFLNILIYTRPKVKKFRISFPEYTWIYSLLLVIKAGGEVPDVSHDPNALILFNWTSFSVKQCFCHTMDWICCCCFGCCFYLFHDVDYYYDEHGNWDSHSSHDSMNASARGEGNCNANGTGNGRQRQQQKRRVRSSSGYRISSLFRMRSDTTLPPTDTRMKRGSEYDNYYDDESDEKEQQDEQL